MFAFSYLLSLLFHSRNLSDICLLLQEFVLSKNMLTINIPHRSKAHPLLFDDDDDDDGGGNDDNNDDDDIERECLATTATDSNVCIVGRELSHHKKVKAMSIMMMVIMIGAMMMAMTAMTISMMTMTAKQSLHCR